MALGSNTLPVPSKLPEGWKAGRLGGEGKDEGEKGWKAEVGMRPSTSSDEAKAEKKKVEKSRAEW
jgi:hypothetical protein